MSTFQGRALRGKVICLLSPTLAPLLRCLEAIVELLLRSGVEPNPGPLTICTLCFNYKTKNKYNMTRHVKFTCLNRGQRKQTSGVRKSRRFLEDKVRSFISNIFNIAFDMQISSPPKLGISSVKDSRRGSKTRGQEVLFLQLQLILLYIQATFSYTYPTVPKNHDLGRPSTCTTLPTIKYTLMTSLAGAKCIPKLLTPPATQTNLATNTSMWKRARERKKLREDSQRILEVSNFSYTYPTIPKKS